MRYSNMPRSSGLGGPNASSICGMAGGGSQEASPLVKIRLVASGRPMERREFENADLELTAEDFARTWIVDEERRCSAEMTLVTRYGFWHNPPRGRVDATPNSRGSGLRTESTLVHRG